MTEHSDFDTHKYTVRRARSAQFYEDISVLSDNELSKSRYYLGVRGMAM